MLGALLLVDSGSVKRGITAGSSERYGGCGLECGHQSMVLNQVGFAFGDDPEDCGICNAQAGENDKGFGEGWHVVRLPRHVDDVELTSYQGHAAHFF